MLPFKGAKVDCKIGDKVECILSEEVKIYPGGYKPLSSFDIPEKRSTLLKCIGVIDKVEKRRGEVYYKVKIEQPKLSKEYLMLSSKAILRIL